MSPLPTDRLDAVIRTFGYHKGALSKSAAHHLRKSGKRSRAKLTFAAAQPFEAPTPLLHVSAAVELLHEASVVHDDIQDRTEYRRGQLTVWRKFGSNTALLLGDHFIASAFRCLAASECRAEVLPALIQAMADATSRATSGQLQQLGLTADERQLCDKYMTLARNKTGALVALPLQFAALLADGDDQRAEYARRSGEQLGLAYQILNDLQPLRTPATLMSHEDMVDRVVTAPVVAVAQVTADKDVFAQLTHCKATRQQAIQRCRGWVRQAVALARTNAGYTPQAIAQVVEHFIAQYLSEPKTAESSTASVERPPANATWAEA